MTTTNIDIPAVGPILFAKGKRTERLSNAIKLFKRIRVAVLYLLKEV